jgi:type I restriction enzyme R subunit
VQSRIDIAFVKPANNFFEAFEVNEQTLKYIKSKDENDNTKIINLVKTIEKTAEEKSDDPYLIMLAERAKAVQEKYEDRQSSTQATLDDLLKLMEENEKRKQEQIKKGFDGLTFFIYRTLMDAKVPEAAEVSRKIKQVFVDFPNWRESEKELREIRSKVTFAVYAVTDDTDKVAGLVEELFALLEKAYKI